jgi:cAMP-binding proteins - catabolite gene activator and regulatory subunit of cAMP-dependent protein kinases
MVKRMKSEAFDVYSQYMAKNMQRIEQETHSATHKKEVFLQRTYSHKNLNTKETAPKSPRSSKTNDSQRRIILAKENDIWKGDPKFDLTFDEKLLLLNNKKGLPYFDKGLAVFKKLNTLSDGDFFGELALIFHTTRTASIIASEDCHLLKISSDDFKTIFGSQINNVVNKLDFVSTLFPKLS